MDDLLRDYFDHDKIELRRISGGDINEAFLAMVDSREFFIKYNQHRSAGAMFDAEKKALNLMNTVIPNHVPKVIGLIASQNGSILVLEYLKPTPSRANQYKNLGKIVAKLHTHASTNFGLDHDNFIGTLPQINSPHESFIDFYTNCRILPQMSQAYDSRLLSEMDTKCFYVFLQELQHLIPEESPSLIHGDLWAGNHLFSLDGQPYLIDPAISFAHREMDIAMSKLFGGYPEDFYNSYQDVFPLIRGWENRMEIYQLYYILVHLNLFGKSYYASVMRIIEKYT